MEVAFPCFGCLYSRSCMRPADKTHIQPQIKFFIHLSLIGGFMSRNNSQPFHRNCLINRMLKASGDALGLPDLKQEQEKWEDDFFKEFEKELK